MSNRVEENTRPAPPPPALIITPGYEAFVRESKALAAAEEVLLDEKVVVERRTLAEELARRMTVQKVAEILCDMAENDDKPEVQLKAVIEVMKIRKLIEASDEETISRVYVLPSGTEMKLVPDTVSGSEQSHAKHS